MYYWIYNKQLIKDVTLMIVFFTTHVTCNRKLKYGPAAAPIASIPGYFVSVKKFIPHCLSTQERSAECSTAAGAGVEIGLYLSFRLLNTLWGLCTFLFTLKPNHYILFIN